MLQIPAVQNDFGYQIAFTLQYLDGSVFNLSGVTTLNFRAQRVNNPGVKFTNAMVVDNATMGQCHYVVHSTDFTAATTYNAQIQAIFSTSEIVTWTNIQVVVYPEVPFPA